MRIGSGGFTYEWIENWARIPDTASRRANGRTHAVAVAANGDVIVFHQATPGVVRFNARGQLVNAWGDRFGGAHGMTLVDEGGEEFLWLVDQDSAEVVKTTLDGQTVLTLKRPDLPIYTGGAGDSGGGGGKYVPTWACVNEERHGGNGDIWVTDGYGTSFIHRYSRAGAYLGSINGAEGKAGAFACPHGIRFSYRQGEPELYIADRANRRLQVYDGAGQYKRVVEHVCHSPCGMVFQGEFCYVPELFTGIKILDGKDRLVASLGDNEVVRPNPAAGTWWPPRCPKDWPNLAGTQYIKPGQFNSPHGLAVAPNGDIYVVEWIVGGRITRLAKVTA